MFFDIFPSNAIDLSSMKLRILAVFKASAF
jgi:hypothetical protein